VADGARLLAREPLRVRVAGADYFVPYRTAAEWVLELDRPAVLVARLADEETRGALVRAVVRDPRAKHELRAESLRILAEATGRKWWEAGRLLSTSVAPEVLGRLLLSGVDPWQRSVGEWCAAVYALCVKGRDTKDRLKFDFSLAVPPPGHEDEWDDEGDDADAIVGDLAKLGMM